MSRVNDGAGPSTSRQGNLPPPPQTRTGRSYKYTKLCEVKVSYNSVITVNIFAAVKFFKPPFQTRGTDWCMMVKLVDPSIDDLEKGLKCLFFAKDLCLLPQIQSVGDIVRMHRLRVENYQGAPQGKKGPGFSCLVFDGRTGTPTKPRSDSQNFTFGPEDEDKVLELRQWVALTPELTPELNVVTLADVEEGQYLDLSCQIVSMARVDEVCVLFQVWDGTIPTEPFRQADLETLSLDQRADLAQKVKGHLVDVFLYDNHVKAALKFKPGDFVKICNLHVAKFKPPDDVPDPSDCLVEFVLHNGTSFGRGLMALSADDPDLKDMKSTMKQVIETSKTTEESTSKQGSKQPSREQTIADDVPPPLKRAKTLENSTTSDDLQENLDSSVPEEDINVQIGNNSVPEGDSNVQIGNSNVQKRNSKGTGKGSGMLQKDTIVQMDSNVQEGDSTTKGKDSIDKENNSDSSGTKRKSTLQKKSRTFQKEDRTVQEKDSIVQEGDRNLTGGNSVVPAEGSLVGSSTSSDRRCLQETGTVITGHHHVKATPIHAVLTHDTPFKFRVRAQLVDYSPKDVRDFCKLICPACSFCIEIPRTLRSQDPAEEEKEDSDGGFACLRCKRNQSSDGDAGRTVTPTMKYVYIVKFTLDDGTGSLEAHLWREHAEVFFRDLPPCNLYQQQEKRQVLSDYMQQLCPGGDTCQTPAPWMECCVMSYTVKESGPLFQIFDTTLALEAA